MLTIHYSNRMESLLGELVDELLQPMGSALQGEPIMVQNTGMSRWLSLRLAQALGIAANIQFSLPAGFLWRTFQQVLGDVPEERCYNVSSLSWRLMTVIEQTVAASDERFQALHAYLAGEADGPSAADDATRRFELCRRLAQCYDQYLVYRPDWIEAWGAGEADHWQAELWRQLVAATDGEHWIAVQQRFQRALAQRDERAGALPARVSVFGVSALSPTYLAALQTLSTVVDVHLYALNPCREYWGDIVARRVVGRRAARSGGQTLYLETGNSLLASLGRQGRDMIDLLQELNAQVRESWSEPDDARLLGLLQADLLQLRDRAGFAERRVELSAGDRSVQIHVCHSPQREVEILHDQLLDRLADDASLTPADILIMAPDIESYVPFIDAVFSSAPNTRRLPYSIADRSLEQASQLVESFFQLLELVDSRYEADRVMALLEVPAIQARADLSEDDLPLLRHWLHATGIRWGVDAAARVAQGLPALGAHSWRAGLERLLLGYAMPRPTDELYRGVLPWGDLEGEGARVLGALVAFAERLFALAHTLAGERSVNAWADSLLRLCDEFFLPDQAREQELQALRDALEQLRAEARLGAYQAAVPLELVVAELRRQLRTRVGAVGFVHGGLTFAGLAPLRGVPFKLICLIGMNEGACPGSQFPLGFDLMAGERRKGDSSVRDEDRHLFLEALSAAREQLYLSYLGQDPHDNSSLPPSVLVSELLDYLRANVVAPGHDDVVAALRVEHPLQPFSRRYFDGADPALFSYDQSLASAAAASATGVPAIAPFMDQPLPEAGPEWRRVELDQLIRFFTHPARFLLQRRLGVNLETGGALLPDHEPFALDFFADLDLRQQLLSHRLQGRAPAELLPVLQAGSLLPHAAVGRSVFNAQIDRVDAFAERLRELADGEVQAPLTLNIPLGEFQLVGALDGLTRAGFRGYHVDKMRSWMWIRLWLSHLALCAADSELPAHSLWLADDKTVSLRAPAQPKALLQGLLEVYWRGLHAPVHFFPKSALDYVEAGGGRGDDDSRALAKAYNRWALAARNDIQPEGSNPYFHLLFAHHTDPLNDEFVALASQFYGPALQCVEVE